MKPTSPSRSGAFSGRFRGNITFRLTILFLLVSLGPSLTGVTGYLLSRRELIDLALSKVEQEAGLISRVMTTYMQQFHSDLHALSRVPPIQGMLRSARADGIDPFTRESYDSWKNRLEQIFAASIQGKGFYRQIGFLDATGVELVRIDYRHGQVTVASDDTRVGVRGLPLQDRNGEELFTAAVDLDVDEVFVSSVTLDHDRDGAIIAPETPVMRFSTPIRDAAGTVSGVLFTVVYAESFLSLLEVHDGMLVLTDENEQYLIRQDSARAMAHDPGVPAPPDDDLLGILATIRSEDRAQTAYLPSHNAVVSVYPIEIDPSTASRRWMLVRTLPENAVIGPIQAFGNVTLVVTLATAAAVLLMARWFASAFTAPITRLTETAERIAATEQLDEHLPEGGKDEIGRLLVAFRTMVVNLKHAATREELLHHQVARRASELAREKRRAESAGRAKSEFLANMSHELRTPLNSILGYSQLLMTEPILDDRQRRGIEAIEKSSRHLLTLINDILDISKIEADKLELESAVLEIRPFLDEVAEMVDVGCREKGLSFSCTIQPGVPVSIVTDEKRLRQILLNLLSNAIKFTDEGGSVELAVRQAGWTGGLLTIEFVVADTGIGIAPQYHDSIFLPFEQPVAHARSHGGAGLGLAISRRLVNAMGGTLTATSEPGRGSTFCFTIRTSTSTETDHGRTGIVHSTDQTTSPIEKPTIPAVPERNEIRKILSYARLGKMGRVRDAALQLRAVSTSYDPFCTLVIEYAKDFDETALVSFLSGYLEEK